LPKGLPESSDYFIACFSLVLGLLVETIGFLGGFKGSIYIFLNDVHAKIQLLLLTL